MAAEKQRNKKGDRKDKSIREKRKKKRVGTWRKLNLYCALQ